MKNIQSILADTTESIRWVARLASFLLSILFLFIILLAVTNEDPPQAPAIPVLVLLGITVTGCILAWRWEKVGGGIIVAGSVGLGIAVYSASLAFGLSSNYVLFLSIYCLPFLITGALFLACGRTERKEN